MAVTMTTTIGTIITGPKAVSKIHMPQGWECDSMAEHVLSIYKALG